MTEFDPPSEADAVVEADANLDVDAWAAEHGMRLAARWSTWSRTPFDPSCERHVSTWVLDES